MMKKRKAGEKGTKWQHSGMKSKNRRRSWNKEGWKEAPLQLEVMRKVPDIVVHERMSQGKGVKGFKEKKKVSGWSLEEMREKPNIAVEVDTEEMRKWRGLTQSEMDLCWKHLAERMEEEVLSKYEVEESKKEAFRGGGAPPGMEKGAQKQQLQNKKVVRRLLGKNFSLFRKYNMQRQQSKQEELTEEEEMKQQRMVIL